MRAVSAVDRLYKEALDVLQVLGDSEPSLATVVNENFRKSLLLAAASYFEHRISSCVVEFVRDAVQGNELVVEIVRNKAVSRQYHTWFNWADKNANSFFGLFGAKFKEKMVAKVRSDEVLEKAIIAFLEVGNERNKLVHQDFASFSLEKTLQEIYATYKRASVFVDTLDRHLRE